MLKVFITRAIPDAGIKMLEEKGYEVLLAADGQEGLEKAQISDPDLIILDMIIKANEAGEFEFDKKKVEVLYREKVIEIPKHRQEETGIARIRRREIIDMPLLQEFKRHHKEHGQIYN